MISSVGSSAVLQLFAGWAAPSSKAEEAARRISEIVHGMRVGASPARTQFASLVGSIVSAPAPSTQAVEPASTEATTPATAAAPTADTTPVPVRSGLWEDGLPRVRGFASMNSLMQRVAHVRLFEQTLEHYKTNREYYVSRGSTIENLDNAEARIEAHIAEKRNLQKTLTRSRVALPLTFRLAAL